VSNGVEIGARPVSPYADVAGLDTAANYPLNCWYVVAASDEVGRGLLARTVLGQPVVIYRLRSGQVAALEDRCPHRSLPFSAGTLSDDEVVCGYHGMAFGADGRCLRVPSQENVPYGARARSFQVREEPPLVWIWLGHPATSTLSDPPALPWLADPAWDTFGETMDVDANYLLLHENALDLTHFPHVHPEFSPAPYLSVPPPLEIAVSETSVSYHRDFPPARLVDWQARTTGLPQDRDYAQRESGEFVSPGLHIDRMHILPDGDGERGGSYDKILTRAFTPVNGRSTMVFWQVSRNYLTGQLQISEQLREVHHATLLADKRLLEAIQGRAGSFPAGEEFNVSADVAALRAQRIIEDMLAAERGWHPAPGRAPATASS
jgi:phenylpropionate dioxygenase-like ring-hydroxylating dioxygenase large terminal subunit